MTPRSITCAALLATCLLATACATTPALGVRPEFKARAVSSLSIAPAYATSSFGLATDSLDSTLRDAESRAVSYLTSRGFDVIDPATLRASLEERDAWTRFSEGAPSTRPLDRAFERTPDGAEAVEVTTLRELSDTLPDRPVLFLELVYYSEVSCIARADEQAPRAVVRVRPGAPDSFPRPCVVGHLQAKLVESGSGVTMWHNRVLLEDHLPGVDDPSRAVHMDALVAMLLGGDDGLENLSPKNKG